MGLPQIRLIVGQPVRVDDLSTHQFFSGRHGSLLARRDRSQLEIVDQGLVELPMELEHEQLVLPDGRLERLVVLQPNSEFEPERLVLGVEIKPVATNHVCDGCSELDFLLDKQNADAVVVLKDEIRERLRRYGLPHDKVTLHAYVEPDI